MADDENKILADAKKLAMPERIAHANWKVRSAAYDDIKQTCSGVYDEADPVLSEYGKMKFTLHTRTPWLHPNTFPFLCSSFVWQSCSGLECCCPRQSFGCAQRFPKQSHRTTCSKVSKHFFAIHFPVVALANAVIFADVLRRHAMA